MFALEMLRGARELLSDPDKWTQNAFARTANDYGVDAIDPAAVCFCLDGALHKVENKSVDRPDSFQHQQASMILNDAVRELTAFATFVTFNDDEGTAHADVLRVLDRAIELAEAR